MILWLFILRIIWPNKKCTIVEDLLILILVHVANQICLKLNHVGSHVQFWLVQQSHYLSSAVRVGLNCIRFYNKCWSSNSKEIRFYTVQEMISLFFSFFIDSLLQLQMFNFIFVYKHITFIPFFANFMSQIF